jgi:outer membrane autotransporter protein
VAQATTPNAIQSLGGPTQGGLLSYTGISDPGLLNLYNAALGNLTGGSSAAANRIGQQLAPVQASSSAQQSTFDVLALVNNRLSAQAGVPGTGPRAQAGMSGIATGEAPSTLGAWTEVFGGQADQGSRSGVAGYGATYGGVLVGADRAVGEAWRVGGLFSYANTLFRGVDATAADTARINAYGLMGYAGYTGQPWYLNLSGGVVFQHYDTTRAVSMTGFSGAASGSFDGRQVVMRAEAGYPLALAGGVTATPLAGLSYGYLEQDGYTERGGNGAALTVGASHANSLRSTAGLRLSKRFETSQGALMPELSLQWLHEFVNARQLIGAHFAGDPFGQTSFTTTGMAPVSDMASIGAGVSLMRADDLTVSLRYELQTGGGFTSQTGFMRLRKMF